MRKYIILVKCVSTNLPFSMYCCHSGHLEKFLTSTLMTLLGLLDTYNIFNSYGKENKYVFLMEVDAKY